MLKKLVFLTLFSIIAIFGIGQSLSPTVFASAGGTNSANAITLDWTLGEMAIETYASPKQIFTQGFHQPILILTKPSTIISSILSGYNVSIYPNPVNSIVNVAIESPVAGRISVRLSDVNGHAVYNQSAYADKNTIKIDISRYSRGVYLLTLTNSSGLSIGSYKIVKAN